METPILKIAGLHKSYGDNAVLKGIDLDVSRGELVFMIGPSGSGKSSLLRCCNRLEEPTAGSIHVDGEEITAPSAELNRIRQNIGMVFQHFNLYRHMSVLSNITLALRKVQKLARAEADRRGLEALDRVGLADKANAYPDQLSGGQQQRVGIARSLALRPKVVL
ncbi:ATP-binding cassette domain-containing protein, partial [Pseudomonas aeruginosa]|nr:ATP-binding cassette domain-containing protein [Pseudomonas aeruginosa]